MIQADDYALATDQVIRMWVDGPIRPAGDAVRARTREMLRGHTFLHHKPFPAPPESEWTSEPVPVAEPPQPMTEREKWGELNLPALIMVGEYDWPEEVAMAKMLADYIPNAEQIIIPNAAHITNLEQPEAFNRAVSGFLTRH